MLMLHPHFTDKKEYQIFLIYSEIQNGAVAKSYMTNGLLNSPHIWLNIWAFPHILGSPSSYMTLQLLHSEFPYTVRKVIFSFLSVFYSTEVSTNFHERVMNLQNCNKKNVVDIRKLELAYRELISYRDFTYLMQSWEPCETVCQTFTLKFNLQNR